MKKNRTRSIKIVKGEKIFGVLILIILVLMPVLTVSSKSNLSKESTPNTSFMTSGSWT